MSRLRPAIALLGAALLWAFQPAAAAAQTLTSAVLRGTVVDSIGAPVSDARVVVRDVSTGFERSARTDATGEFLFALLPPGEYGVTAEKLMYGPEHRADLRLLPGRSASVTLELLEVEPPVMAIDTTRDGSATAWSRAGVSRWFGPLELDAPRARATDRSLLGVVASAGDRIRDGMPTSGVSVAPEGFVFGDDGSSFDGLDIAPGALARLGGAELIAQHPYAQWDGGAAPQLFTYSRSGSRDWSLRSWGTGSDAQTEIGAFSSDRFLAYDRARAGVEAGGPVVADTAVFVIGGEWRRLATVEPRAWRIDELTGARIASTAQDGAGLSLLGLTLPRTVERDELAGWGRLDWRIGTPHDFTVFADARLSRPEPVAPLLATPARNREGDRLEVTAGGTLRSILGTRFGNELRVGIRRATLDVPLPGDLDAGSFGADGVPATSVVSGSLQFGANPMTPTSIERTSFRLEQSFLAFLRGHTLAAGLAVDWDRDDREHAFARSGVFTFGSGAAFEDGVGSFVRQLGAPAVSSFSVLEPAVFVQDVWRPVPGLELTGALRVSDERLPTDGVQEAGLWRDLTGLSTAPSEERLRQFSPRAGMLWDVRDAGRWIARASIGLYHDDVSTQLLSERQAFDGGGRLQRTLGAVGTWPAAPDSAAADSRGRLLTFFGPEFRAPRTTRASVGISRIGALALHLSATYRFTDFLPARRDLNRLALPSGQDQYGRAIFGELVQQGALVAAAPGSNRRFDSFDVVSVVESSAFSEYWGLDAIVEKRVGRFLRLVASYTFSTTRDNWLAHPGAFANDALAPQLDDAASTARWIDATSSFDVPHRATLVAEITTPLPLAPTIGLVYRARSGLPFTPGFQPGVDVNGDYASNDPAFIDESLPGMEPLLGEWSCLRDQAGGFADRNSCRGPALHALDLRLGFDIGFGRASRARLYVDALDLLERELMPPDAALFLVDESGTITVDDDGITHLPLVVNERFGEPVRGIGSGRVFRVGLEVSL